MAGKKPHQWDFRLADEHALISTHPSNRWEGFADGGFCGDASTTTTNKSNANLNGLMQYRKIIAERFTYHFVIAV
jgi:hypothetical protein